MLTLASLKVAGVTRVNWPYIVVALVSAVAIGSWLLMDFQRAAALALFASCNAVAFVLIVRKLSTSSMS